jgi:subtilisin family serine protease
LVIEKGIYNLTWRLMMALILLVSSTMATAKSPRLEPLDNEGKRTWIIELADPSVLRYEERNYAQNRTDSLEAGRSAKTHRRFDLLSPRAIAYSSYLDERFEQFLSGMKQTTGEMPRVKARYKNLVNGFALRLTAAQAERVRRLPGVKSLVPNEIYYLETDASPDLIGASQIWAGESGLPSSRGEGIVIGMVDTGINWDHPSFQDPAPDGYDHSNPLGEQLGLCSDSEVLCSDKIIGVYDFTDEGSKGKDTDFH